MLLSGQILFKLIYRFNTIPKQIIAKYLDIDTLILKLALKVPGTWIPQTLLEKKNSFKTYCSTMVGADKETDTPRSLKLFSSISKVQRLDHTSLYEQLIFDKGTKTVQWKKSFQQNSCNNWTFKSKINKPWLIHCTVHKATQIDYRPKYKT